MALEIERKFLVSGDGWRVLATGTPYCQGYLAAEPTRTVRVRIAGDQGYLTIKGLGDGLSRPEYEYAIPLTDAQEMLHRLCLPPLIEKVRYKIAWQGLIWEVDEFAGENQGLILAEVELEHPDQAIELPPWIGQEVTGDPRYYNARLREHPYRQW